MKQLHPQNSTTRLPPLILAATQFELASLRAAVEKHGIPVSFACIGVGPGAVLRWGNSHPAAQAAESPIGRTVILAGLAGALDPNMKVGSARSARMIIGAGADWAHPRPAYQPPLRSNNTAVIAAVDRVCTTAIEKRALRQQTQADMVDMESAAFAAIASAREWNWAVLRGVSDDHATALAPWMTALVHDNGSLNVLALFAALLRRPSRMMQLIAMRSAAHQAMRAVGEELIAMLKQLEQPKRVLIFGGTFDPPHRRHAQMVEAAAKFLNCARVLIVPTGESPLRDGHIAAPKDDRLAMAQRAFAALPGAVIDRREIDRGGPSFTVDTLREIASELSTTRENLVLLIGGDQALQFDRWKSWREIDCTLATIAVVPRPPLAADQLAAQLDVKFAALGADGPRWRMSVLPFAPIDLSATEVRGRLRANKPIADLVDPAVEEWIRSRRLYA